MKRLLLLINCLLLASLSFVQFGFAQTRPHQAPPFEVNRMRPFVSIEKAQLAKASNLLDINPRYNSNWVKNYQSVAITTTQQGQVLTNIGPSNVLTNEQKRQLVAADLGSEISVLIQYMPENNLKHNELQEMGFSFVVEADIDASYIGGQQKLLSYLRETAIDQLASDSFGEWGMSAVKFTVDKSGQISDVEAIEPVENTHISTLLVESICNMPQWHPARYITGVTVAQQFALTVGNQANCKIALLNIRDLD